MIRIPPVSACLVALAALAAWPYSNFSYLSDLGSEILPAGARGTALGNSDAGLSDSTYVSLSNPAGLAFLRRTMINLKFIPEFDRLQSASGGDTLRYVSYDQDLPYFRLCLPLGRAGYLGLGYQAQNTQHFSTLLAMPGYNGVVDSLLVSQSGILYNLALTYAYRMGPFSLGARVLLNSGTVTHRDDRVSLEGDSVVYLDTLHSSGLRTLFSGTHFELGAAFQSKRGSVGAAAALPYHLTGTRIFHNNAEGVFHADWYDTTHITYDLPFKFRGGGRFRILDNLSLSAEGAYDFWSRSTGSDSPRFPKSLRNGWQAGGGVEFVPFLDSRRFYLLHIPYRAGGYLSQWSFAGVRERVITCGVGLPLGDHSGTIDLAMELGERTSRDAAYQNLQEQFIRFSVEVSHFSLWGKVLYKKKKKPKTLPPPAANPAPAKPEAEKPAPAEPSPAEPAPADSTAPRGP